MVGRIKSLFLLGLTFWSFQVQAVSYLEVKAKPGDGIGVLLDRYNLSSYKCNVDSFLALNKLERSSYLILDKIYKLPIHIESFNGQSIRSSIGISDYQTALNIQNYNDEMLKLGVKELDFRTDKVLWVPLHILHCNDAGIVRVESTTTEAPDTSVSTEEVLRYETFPILGPDYEKTPIVSEKLKGHVFYLVSGHGGPDPGAIGHKDGHMLCEDEYAYDITLRLARNLLQHSAIVYMITRDSDGIRDEEYLDPDHDETVWYNQTIPLSQLKRLRQRTAKINELYAKHASEGVVNQQVVEIHIDSRYQTQKVDIFFYHYPGSKKGQDMANTMLETVRSEYEEHQKNREYKGVVKSRDLHTLRESKAPAVYIELGNITNDFDQKRLLIVNNRQAIANWLAQGILEYYVP